MNNIDTPTPTAAQKNICRLANERGEFVTDVDGLVYYLPSPHVGHFSPYQLRTLADELDKRNAPWETLIDSKLK